MTTRSKKTSIDSLREAGITDLFDVVISGEDAPALKPDPAPVLKALELLGEKPDNAVMVGDSHLDIAAGKNAGTKTVRAAYGFHTAKLHEPEPDYIIHDIAELPTIINYLQL